MRFHNTAATPEECETLVQMMVDAYPKKISITSMSAGLHAGRPKVENALSTLVAQGRVKGSVLNVCSTLYTLTLDEADKQGIKRENPVRSSTEPLYSRPTYSPKPMNPSRHDATEAMAIMSRRGDVHVPHRGPIGIASHVRGGA